MYSFFAEYQETSNAYPYEYLTTPNDHHHSENEHQFQNLDGEFQDYGYTIENTDRKDTSMNTLWNYKTDIIDRQTAEGFRTRRRRCRRTSRPRCRQRNPLARIYDSHYAPEVRNTPDIADYQYPTGIFQPFILKYK